jgi:hypothetical protein
MRFDWLRATCVASYVLLTACGGRASEDTSVDSGIADASSSDNVAHVPLDATASFDGAKIHVAPDAARPCNALTCPEGCCSEGQCQQGVLLSACGFGGQACTDCAKLGLSCEVFDSYPATSMGCKPRYAPDAGAFAQCALICGGCCTPDGTCMPPTAKQCGGNGRTCVDCSGPNQTCSASRQCIGAGACNPSNCAGCCDENGQCLDSVALGLCGIGGVFCHRCTAGQACLDGFCETVP